MEKRTLTVHGIPVLVTFTGEGQPLLCLHGWGRHVDHKAFDELREALKDAPIQIIVPDLPGFGESNEPPSAWSVSDYADCIDELVREFGLNDVWLLGHSFGGRVALKLAARQGVVRHGSTTLTMTPWMSRLFLCAAAGVGRDLLIRRRSWLFVAKVGNAFFLIPGLKTFKPFFRKILYKLLRVHDYEEASERMRKTMAVVVEEDLTPCLESITVPTDLFWGEADTITPPKDGELMNKKIVQSSLHTYASVGHRVHRLRAGEIGEVIRGRL